MIMKATFTASKESILGTKSRWENKLYIPHQMSSLKAQYNTSNATNIVMASKKYLRLINVTTPNMYFVDSHNLHPDIFQEHDNIH